MWSKYSTNCLKNIISFTKNIISSLESENNPFLNNALSPYLSTSAAVMSKNEINISIERRCAPPARYINAAAPSQTRGGACA